MNGDEKIGVMLTSKLINMFLLYETAVVSFGSVVTEAWWNLKKTILNSEFFEAFRFTVE